MCLELSYKCCACRVGSCLKVSQIATCTLYNNNNNNNYNYYQHWMCVSSYYVCVCVLCVCVCVYLYPFIHTCSRFVYNSLCMSLCVYVCLHVRSLSLSSITCTSFFTLFTLCTPHYLYMYMWSQCSLVIYQHFNFARQSTHSSRPQCIYV